METKFDHLNFEKEARKIWDENKIYEFDKTSKKEKDLLFI